MGDDEKPQWFGGYGTFSLTIRSGKDLRMIAENPCTRVRVKFGVRVKSTPVIPGYEPMWNSTLEFPVDRETETCVMEVWDASEGTIPELLGSFTVSVGGQNATGTHWCNLSPTPSGQLHVEWDYTYDATGDPVERSGGNLIMEVVKAKGLPTGEFDEAVTSFAQLFFGGHVRRTKVKKNTCDPFWNDVFDLKPMDPDDRMQFMVLNGADESEIGRCMLDVAFWGENKKGSTWMPLTLVGQEEGDESHGELFVRYKFTVRKRRVEEKKAKDTEFIELGYVPKINGEMGLIPDNRVYVWYQLLESKPFRNQYTKALLSEMLKRERTKEKVGMGQSPWVEVPYESVDELVEMNWKCKTRHLLFNKIRSTATQLMLEGTVITTPDQEQREWYRWKEYAVMRSEISSSIKVEKTLKALYNLVMFGQENPAPHETLVAETRLTKKTHQILCQHVYCAFLPDLSKRVARRIASEDWDRYDEQHSDHPEDHHLFIRIIKEFTCFWCETITEFEFQTLLGSFVPILIRARQDFNDRPGTGGKKRPGTAKSPR
mmetsp:Transcript_48036/g.85747  ORF Transcript_48036/g.85747 Transcript_48036/m.85747 type:complete len:543 (-) Transcript_48036:163-1791(-)